MAGEEIGQVKGTRLAFGLFRKACTTVEFVAVGAGDANGVGIAGQQRIQRAERAAVAVADEDAVEASGPGVQFFGHLRGDAFGAVMQLRWNGGQFIVPAAAVGDGDEFAHDGAAGDDSDFHDGSLLAANWRSNGLMESKTAALGYFGFPVKQPSNNCQANSLLRIPAIVEETDHLRLFWAF